MKKKKDNKTTFGSDNSLICYISFQFYNMIHPMNQIKVKY